jgi:hypothetical protein
VLKSRQALPDPEILLLDYAERLTHHRAGRRALYVTLSKLAPATESGGHWRVFDNLLAPIVRRRGGETFRLGNGDAAVILASADRELADRITQKLHVLFRDDPLFMHGQKEGKDLLSRWFDLAIDYDAFLTLARKIKAEAETAPPPQPIAAPPPAPRTHKEPQEAPLMRWLTAPVAETPALQRLANTSLAARMRPGDPPLMMFELLSARAEALLELGLPETDLERNPNLRAAFAAMATRRLLLEIAGARTHDAPLAIEVGLDNLLGAELLMLHRNWALGRWTPLTFIIPHRQMLADGARLVYVRKMLRKLGHRLGIGAAPIEVLSMRDKLDADLVTLAWSPAYGTGDHADFDSLRDAFAKKSPENVMLTGVDTREALAFARNLGITLIAGRQAAQQLSRR